MNPSPRRVVAGAETDQITSSRLRANNSQPKIRNMATQQVNAWGRASN